MYVTTTTFTVASADTAEVLERFAAAQEAARRQDGWLGAVLLQEEGVPNSFLRITRWESLEFRRAWQRTGVYSGLDLGGQPGARHWTAIGEFEP